MSKLKLEIGDNLGCVLTLGILAIIIYIISIAMNNDKLTKTLTHGLMHGIKVENSIGKDSLIVLEFTDEVFKSRREVRLNHAIERRYKPYLFDMSDLAKEIEHKGERFVPHRKLQKLNIGYADWTSTESKTWIKEFGYDGWFDRIPNGIMEWLIEHHFNIFGLEPDQFIKVTNENNPYKI